MVAIIGNAAGSTAPRSMAAADNRMDLSIGIAVGSSIQIALFVAPVLVLASLLQGPKPMDLVFTLPEILAVVMAVAIAGQVTSDGESHWLEGVQLLSVYIILAMVSPLPPRRVRIPSQRANEGNEATKHWARRAPKMRPIRRETSCGCGSLMAKLLAPAQSMSTTGSSPTTHASWP